MWVFLKTLMPLRSWLMLGGGLLFLVLVIVWLLWYGNARFKAGEAAADARWLEASARLADQAEKSADTATRREAPRIEENAAKVAAEKERLDAAVADGSSPFDALFPAR